MMPQSPHPDYTICLQQDQTTHDLLWVVAPKHLPMQDAGVQTAPIEGLRWFSTLDALVKFLHAEFIPCDDNGGRS